MQMALAAPTLKEASGQMVCSRGSGGGPVPLSSRAALLCPCPAAWGGGGAGNPAGAALGARGTVPKRAHQPCALAAQPPPAGKACPRLSTPAGSCACYIGALGLRFVSPVLGTLKAGLGLSNVLGAMRAAVTLLL